MLKDNLARGLADCSPGSHPVATCTFIHLPPTAASALVWQSSIDAEWNSCHRQRSSGFIGVQLVRWHRVPGWEGSWAWFSACCSHLEGMDNFDKGPHVFSFPWALKLMELLEMMRLCDLQSLKCLLSGSLQNKFSEPWFNWSSVFLYLWLVKSFNVYNFLENMFKM